MLSRSIMSNSLWPYGLQHARLLCPWDFPGKSIGMGCCFPLHGIFLTQMSWLFSPFIPFLEEVYLIWNLFIYTIEYFLVIKSLESIAYLMHNVMVFYWGKKSRLRKEKHRYRWRVRRGGWRKMKWGKKRQDLRESKIREKWAKQGERAQRQKMNSLGSSLRPGTNHTSRRRGRETAIQEQSTEDTRFINRRLFFSLNSSPRSSNKPIFICKCTSSI